MARNHASFSLPLVGRARVGVLAPDPHRHSLTPPSHSSPQGGGGLIALILSPNDRVLDVTNKSRSGIEPAVTSELRGDIA